MGRRDALIKTSGYRVSPTEVEDIVARSKLSGECAVLGLPSGDPLGDEIHLVVSPPGGVGRVDESALLQILRRDAPSYMLPRAIHHYPRLPRSPNGKIDRARLQADICSSIGTTGSLS
ncbi:MAG: hypothetical protein M5U09_10010 [Gammaproteobacteria bacterium]|nr:hypothetical protein [Gammaproteobacteria bacterium]